VELSQVVRPISQGGRGPAVEDVQKRLLMLGFDLGPTGVDGVFWGATLSAVRQMSLLTADKGSTVKYLFAKNVLRISASAQGLGSGEVEIDVEHPGENLEIAFNPSFLIDILKNVDEEFVYFELTNSLNPALITPMNDRSYLCVVMPMRL
jgi:DNA polymerase III sliding clamp (beta) subunit (PCNA family)